MEAPDPLFRRVSLGSEHFGNRPCYTPARKDYIHKFCYWNYFPPKLHFSYTKIYISWINFPQMTWHVLFCDSENFMEKLSRNYFLRKSHFSYIKKCFRSVVSIVTRHFPYISSKTKVPGELGAARYCPKILLLKRAKMVLCPFYAHRPPNPR